jgi:hypothetical protein
LLELRAIPFVKGRLLLFFACSRPDLEKDAVVGEFDGRSRVLFDQAKQVALFPKVVTFAVEIFARRFALLRGQLAALLPDPGQLGDGKDF